MKKILLLLVLLLPLLASIMPKAYAVDVEPFQATFELNTYAETKIIVSYAFTQNVSSIANSAGKSVWHTTEDPYTAKFATEALDKFTWQLEIQYSLTVAQTLTIAVWSGSQAVNTQELTVKTDKITLIFTATVTQEPRYPTAEEVAQKGYEIFRNEFAEMLYELRTENELNRQQIMMQWVVLAITFSGFMILVFKRSKGAKS